MIKYILIKFILMKFILNKFMMIKLTDQVQHDLVYVGQFQNAHVYLAELTLVKFNIYHIHINQIYIGHVHDD